MIDFNRSGGHERGVYKEKSCLGDIGYILYNCWIVFVLQSVKVLLELRRREITN